jgi:pilus assembly protein CpaC
MVALTIAGCVPSGAANRWRQRPSRAPAAKSAERNDTGRRPTTPPAHLRVRPARAMRDTPGEAPGLAAQAPGNLYATRATTADGAEIGAEAAVEPEPQAAAVGVADEVDAAAASEPMAVVSVPPMREWDENQPGDARIITNFEGTLQVPAGRSIVARLSRPAERVAISDPEVAEVVVINPREVLINGKGRKTRLESGEVVVREAQTSVIVWDRQGRSDMRTLYVNRSRREQILLEVTVAEINRSALERYGVDWIAFEQGNLIMSTPAKIISPGETITDVFPGGDRLTGEFPVNPSRLTGFYRNFNEDFAVFLEALQQEALAKILARPVLLARSGEEAHLRVGGEIPVVYATANVATIQFKEFGTLLSFTPEFTDDGKIDLSAAMEVSEPTSAFATSFGGFDVPSFISRRAETRVLLAEGETLLVGGLYREQTSEDEQKVPYLGDIPFLGFFFRRTVHDVSRTETVMTVRPQVARSPHRLQVKGLPTDRPPLSRGEVRTQSNPYGVTRPRLDLKPAPAPPPDRRSVDEYLETPP